MADIGAVAGAAARGLAVAAVWVGRKTAAAYAKIDPDVPRHLAQLPLLSYSLFSRGHVRIAAGKPDGHPPVVFVHGLGATPGSFLPMIAYFWANGRRRTYRIAFAGRASLRGMARALAAFVEGVRRKTGEPQVDIVAHSLGGVVVRMAIAQYGLAPAVHAAVMMGSPLAGTYLARFANTRLTRDLRPDSTAMRTLAATPWPAEVRGVTLWSRNDLFILPAESAALAGTQAVDMTPLTHYGYLLSPAAWQAALDGLRGQQAGAPPRPRRRSRPTRKPA